MEFFTFGDLFGVRGVKGHRTAPRLPGNREWHRRRRTRQWVRWHIFGGFALAIKGFVRLTFTYFTPLAIASWTPQRDLRSKVPGQKHPNDLLGPGEWQVCFPFLWLLTDCSSAVFEARELGEYVGSDDGEGSIHSGRLDELRLRMLKRWSNGAPSISRRGSQLSGSYTGSGASMPYRTLADAMRACRILDHVWTL